MVNDGNYLIMEYACREEDCFNLLTKPHSLDRIDANWLTAHEPNGFRIPSSVYDIRTAVIPLSDLQQQTPSGARFFMMHKN